jgi:hypothetical protein
LRNAFGPERVCFRTLLSAARKAILSWRIFRIFGIAAGLALIFYEAFSVNGLRLLTSPG